MVVKYLGSWVLNLEIPNGCWGQPGLKSLAIFLFGMARNLLTQVYLRDFAAVPVSWLYLNDLTCTSHDVETFESATFIERDQCYLVVQSANVPIRNIACWLLLY